MQLPPRRRTSAPPRPHRLVGADRSSTSAAAGSSSTSHCPEPAQGFERPALGPAVSRVGAGVPGLRGGAVALLVLAPGPTGAGRVPPDLVPPGLGGGGLLGVALARHHPPTARARRLRLAHQPHAA